MEPKIFEDISKKIDELNALLDTANAQAMGNDQIRSKQLLSTKLHSASGPTLQTLLDRPALYPDRIDRPQFADLLNTYDKIPGLIQKLETCINKTKGWRILTGQFISIVMRRFYRLLGADLPDKPDLKSTYDGLAALFKTGKRKPKDAKDGKNGTDDTNEQNGDSNTPEETTPNA